MRLRVGLLPLSMLVASCMFFRSLDPLRSDSAGGAEGADAAADGTDGADGADGADEAGDALATSADAEADASASPCVAAHSLCADFDQGDILAAGWDPLVRHPTIGLIDLATDKSRSPPRSVSVVHPRRSAGTGEVRNALAKEWLGGWSRARVAFDAFFDVGAWQAGDFSVAPLVILFRSDAGDTGTVLSLGSTGSYMSIERSPREYFDTPAIAYGRWVHIAIDISRSGSLQYVLDGQSGSRSFAATGTGANARLAIELGIHSWDGPSPSVAAHFDNVVIDVE